ncbi:NADPH-cytochrome P450 reductase [Nowakowskiella sp. JEL0407]|nr:NADPH-cytochrome P450 reductase [Nowakowskiella sp. JEL0407]
MSQSFGLNDIIVLLSVGGLTALFFIWKSSTANSIAKSSVAPPLSTNHFSKAATTDLQVTLKPSSKKSITAKLSESEKKINLVFFYGSQTGTAEDLANRLSKELNTKFQFNSLICDPEEYDMNELYSIPSNVLVVFMLATYGEGEPTDNMVEFYDQLMKGQGKGDDDGVEIEDDFDDPDASSLRYVIFGLGNKTYEHFNAMSRRVDKRLKALGAKRIGAAGEGDDDGSLEDDYLNWKAGILKDIAAFFHVDSTSSSTSQNNRTLPHNPSFELIEELNENDPDKIYYGELTSNSPRRWHTPLESAQVERSGYQVFVEKSEISSYDAKHPYYAAVTQSRPLYTNGFDEFTFNNPKIKIIPPSVESRFTTSGNKISIIRQCLHLDIDIEGSGLKYETGDHIGVYPSNSEDEVLALARALNIESKLNDTFTIKPKTSTDKIPFPVPTTYRTALTYYLDLRPELKQHQLEVLAKYATDENEKKKLFEYVDSREKYLEEVEKTQMNLKDILLKFKSVKIPLVVIMTEILSRTVVRYYSISSSSLQHPNTVSVTAVVVRYALSQDTQVAIKEGLSTSWFQRLHESQSAGILNDPNSTTVPKLSVPMYIRSSQFRLPKQHSIPVVMVGPGTGVAPFRGFARERVELAKRGESVGPTWLFFGCRDPEIDFMYKEELANIEKEISGTDFEWKLITAFSRVKGEKKVYVQHRLKEHQARVWELLNGLGGYFYVCGDAKSMAKDVTAALQSMAVECGGMDEEGAKQWVKTLKSGGRYQEDVWA